MDKKLCEPCEEDYVFMQFRVPVSVRNKIHQAAKDKKQTLTAYMAPFARAIAMDEIQTIVVDVRRYNQKK